MKNKFNLSLLIFSFLTIGKIQAQKQLFDTLTVTSGIKILGMYPHHDQNKTYQKYNFILEDPQKIKSFAKEIKLGKETANSFQTNGFQLLIIRDFKRVGVWTVNPKLNNMMVHDGHSYTFDIDQISLLNQQFPFEYELQKKVFTKKPEYESYLQAQKTNVKFLFYYEPQFRYEGSFEMEFKKSKEFPNPKAISEFLTPYVKALVKDDEYRITYSLTEKNMKQEDQYTMTITGPKKLFSELNVQGFKNENWQATKEEAFFFYRK